MRNFEIHEMLSDLVEHLDYETWKNVYLGGEINFQQELYDVVVRHLTGAGVEIES